MQTIEIYRAAIDTLRNSTETPDTIFSEYDKDMMLHRFYGVTHGRSFCVQIKEDKRSGRKDFMSVFEGRVRN